MREQWDELEQYFSQAVEQIQSDRARSRFYAQLGVVLADLVGDLEQADGMYSYALELDSGNAAAQWARQRIALRRQAWGQAAELIYAELEATEDIDRQLELMNELGQLYLEHLHEPDSAAQCFQNVYEYDPANATARAYLEQLGYQLDPVPDQPAPQRGGPDRGPR